MHVGGKIKEESVRGCRNVAYLAVCPIFGYIFGRIVFLGHDDFVGKTHKFIAFKCILEVNHVLVAFHFGVFGAFGSVLKDIDP